SPAVLVGRHPVRRSAARDRSRAAAALPARPPRLSAVLPGELRRDREAPAGAPGRLADPLAPARGARHERALPTPRAAHRRPDPPRQESRALVQGPRRLWA